MNTLIAHTARKQWKTMVFLMFGVCAFLMISVPRSFAQEGNAFEDFLPALPGANETAEPIPEDENFTLQQTQEELEEELRREAFDNAVEGILPLRPNEIKELLEKFDETQAAVHEPIKTPPKPEMVVETLSTDPGSKPAVIKVAFGYVTTLNIVDSTGAPWPIEDITWAGNFEVVEVKSGEAAHFIRIAPQAEYAYGNISIHMLGLQTPIIVSLETSQDVVHYRFDAIIPEAGPLAKTAIMDTGIQTVAGNADMTSVLEGIVPSGAKRMNVSGVDGRTSAYNFQGMTYLRTPHSLLSPAWVSSASSADGMRVYALNNAPVVLLSDKGSMVRARLTPREEMLDE